MGSTVGPRYVTGTVTATGAALAIRKVGFQPKKIVVHNVTNDVKAEWFEELAAASAIKTVAAGTRSLETSDGFTLLAGSSTQPPGFSLGALADVNDTTTEILRYECWG